MSSAVMKITRGFDAGRNRYDFDFNECHFKKGYAQLDTADDAPHYGNWANPFERKVVSFAEGDITVVECETDAQFAREVRKVVGYHKKRGAWKGIDPMCDAKMAQRFIDMGLGGCFHPGDAERYAGGAAEEASGPAPGGP